MSCEIKHHRLAKMEYCYSGTESLWYGSWNRHVCRRGKFAADRHSRSIGVDQSRKQRCCSPSCLWSQAQRDTSDPDNSQNLGYWLTIRQVDMKQDLNILYQVCVFWPISKQKGPPWQIRQKGSTLYSGARYVALWASCSVYKTATLDLALILITFTIEKRMSISFRF